MRGMRACATANAVVLGLLAAAFGFTACAGGSTPPENPTPVSPASSAAATTTVAQLQQDPPKAAKVPKSPADCKELTSDITNDPPANGVALNNAMTAKDAGASDRLELLTAAIKARRDGFRCCFDLYARTHAGAQGSVKMVVELKSDGSVKEVSFADAQNRVSAPEVESCMADLAKSLTYPRSPSGKETKFTYPFDFKAHH
jgi:hypothetical protein